MQSGTPVSKREGLKSIANITSKTAASLLHLHEENNERKEGKGDMWNHEYTSPCYTYKPALDDDGSSLPALFLSVSRGP